MDKITIRKADHDPDPFAGEGAAEFIVTETREYQVSISKIGKPYCGNCDSSTCPHAKAAQAHVRAEALRESGDLGIINMLKTRVSPKDYELVAFYTPELEKPDETS